MVRFLREAWERLRSRRWVRAAAGGLGLALAGNLAFAFFTLNGPAWRELRGMSPTWLALAVALALVPWFTNALRIWIWARFAGGRLQPADAFQISVASDLGAAFTPTAAGSGTVRFAMLLQHGLSAGRASAVLVWMGLEDALFFALFVPASYFLASQSGGPILRAVLARAVTKVAVVLTAALLLGGLLTLAWKAFRRRRSNGVGPRPGIAARLGRIGAWWREARNVLADILHRGKLRATGGFALTIIQWICRYSVIAAILAAFGIRMFPFPHVALQWAVFTAGTLVPTPGGAAAVEAAFAVIYRPFVPPELLGTVTAVWRLVLFYLVILLDAAVLAGFLLRGRSPIQRSGNTAKRAPASIMAENEVSSAPST